MAEAPSPLVVFAVGNASRSDDGAGPALLAALEPALPAGARTVPDFQLQVEHALALRGAGLALFIDAARGLDAPFVFRELAPAAGRALFSHALAPEAVLQVFAQIEGRAPPPAFVLALRAAHFALGAPLSAQAEQDVAAALRFVTPLLAAPCVAAWRAAQAAVALTPGAAPERSGQCSPTG